MLSHISSQYGDKDMDLLWWAIIAVVVSLIAGGLGFSGVAAGAASIAKLLFGLFLLIAIVLFVLIALGIGAAAT
jgi:uncharacterized membrane protein YtjA (UPF0391 family)